MSDSHDLLRDAEVLRKLLTECLRRVGRLERQLRTEAEAAARRPALPLTDPFEQVLPDDGPSDEDGGNATGEPAPTQTPPRRSVTVRTIPPPSTPRTNSESTPSNDPPADPAASHTAPGPLDAFGEAGDWEAETPSGDGALDPFALLDLSVPQTESHDASVTRAMNDLLGGLDVTPPTDD